MQEGGDHEASSGGGFEFLSVEHPTTLTRAASPAALKRVRSHVAKLQHQRSREKIIARRRKAATQSSVGPKHHSSSYKSAAGQGPPSIAGSSAPSVPEAEQRRPLSLFDERSESGDIHAAHDSVPTLSENGGPTLPWNELTRLVLGDPATSFSQGKLAFRTFSLDDPTNIVGMCLSSLGFDVSSILAYYKLMVQIQAKDFEAQFGVPKNSVWEKYFSFVFRDPALLTVAMLLTTRHRLESLDDRSAVHDSPHLLQLETFLIQKVNSALDDPNRALSDPMLVVVALCATYGLKCGNVAAYHIHMSGLVRMIRRRGGLAAIGHQDQDLERMLMWQDVNTATILGQPGYLASMSNSTGEARPASNTATFRAPIRPESRLEL